METLMNILDKLELTAVTDAVTKVTGLINTIFPPEPEFITKLDGFFGNMSSVFTNLGAIDLDFSKFNGVIEAVKTLFGA